MQDHDEKPLFSPTEAKVDSKMHPWTRHQACGIDERNRINAHASVLLFGVRMISLTVSWLTCVNEISTTSADGCKSAGSGHTNRMENFRHLVLVDE